MKKTLRLIIASAFIFSLGIITPSKACDPGEVYVEGRNALGLCWGQTHDSCWKCITAENKK